MLPLTAKGGREGEGEIRGGCVCLTGARRSSTRDRSVTLLQPIDRRHVGAGNQRSRRPWGDGRGRGSEQAGGRGCRLGPRRRRLEEVLRARRLRRHPHDRPAQRIGEFIGIPRIAFAAWNVVKWPILLVILIIAVSLAYYLFPNVRLPRYRLMTLGSTLSVLVLFGTALVAGRLLVGTSGFAYPDWAPVLNGTEAWWTSAREQARRFSGSVRPSMRRVAARRRSCRLM